MNLISEISFFWLLPVLGLSILISFFLYPKRLSNYSKPVLNSLRLLRLISVFLIGLLILNFLVESKDYREEKPTIITLVDESSSMLNYKDSNLIKPTISSFIEKLKNKYASKYNFKLYSIGDIAKVDTFITFNEPASNLSEGFNLIHENFYNKNIGSVIFISDGNYNLGSDPTYSSSKILHTPIFTVGVGDTLLKKDQYVKDLLVNKIAFYKNDFPVKIDIESTRLNGKNATLMLFKKGKKIASKTINYKSDLDYQQVDFLLNADEIGIQNYTVKLSVIDSEFNFKNNIRNFTIEVLESRNKILILSSAPHPDISAIKNEVRKNEKIEVESKLLTEWNKKTDKLDLIIWHEPGLSYNHEIQQLINSNKIPILYVLGTNTKNEIIQKLPIGLKVNQRHQNDENQGITNDNFQLFSISQELKELIPNLPPLTTKFGALDLSANNKIFINQKVGNISKPEPQIFFGENTFSKYGVIYGEGLWKWKLEDFKLNKSNVLFNEIIQKITQLLMVKNNHSSLNVMIPDELNKSDDVVIRAEFYDASNTLITSPIVKFKYTKKYGKSHENEFSIEDNYYSLPLGKLQPGEYSWKASTNYNGKDILKKGVFVVEDIFIEDLDTRANHLLLRQISGNSSGKFYRLKAIDKIIDELENRTDIVNVTYEESTFKKLIDFKWVLFLIIALLVTEWFIRRWFGNY
jgi:hypothetical protein